MRYLMESANERFLIPVNVATEIYIGNLKVIYSDNKCALAMLIVPMGSAGRAVVAGPN